MASDSNIILITNENNVAEVLKPRLVLLRGIDNISIARYEEAVDSIKKNSPDTVLVYCDKNKSEFLTLLKEIKSNEHLKTTTILLVTREYDQDFVLSAYDEGISDYFTIQADDAEILMRTIWCLKKNALVNKVAKQNKLLIDLNVVDEKTKFHSSKYAQTVFDNEIKTLDARGIKAAMMLVTPRDDDKERLDENILSLAIKSSTRNSDIIAHGTCGKFYILLPKTSKNGALCVWDKIKDITGENANIKSAVIEVENLDFKAIQHRLLSMVSQGESLSDAISVEESDTQESDWLNDLNSKQKNFKLFKQAFTKKLEKVITPVFYQIQKIYEDKLFKTNIEQYSNSSESLFSLKRLKRTSELKITYPGFSKINIDIEHKGLDSAENKRISLDLTELTEEKLTDILEEFIKDFDTYS